MAAPARVRVVMAPGWERRVDLAADVRAVGPLAADIAEDAGARAPRRTGALADSYVVEKPRLLVRRIGSHLDYGAAVELGSRPYTIVPRTKRALWWPGADHPVRRVRHPGVRPRPHLRPALYTRRAAPRTTFGIGGAE
ncbi:hypothetical protein [Streptomyces sp. ST2-7A]|uniref:hypothetical protein n=1 Tax=Streptomyces sp. ST2-7A TaxID=2907214 RepID=UPI001F23FFCE|nr:hypothetical protein [Streptomyces sp. ST2-7A]MCE7081159.1 hypothetical protein [Streptomyces sp. ST2-7A]